VERNHFDKCVIYLPNMNALHTVPFELRCPTAVRLEKCRVWN